jgi:hypothetical protein
MPINTSLRWGASALGAIAGLIELYIGLVVAFDGQSGRAKSVLVVVFPLIILAGAIGTTRLRQADFGAGLMLIGFSLQHVLIEIRSFAQIPLAIILVATVLAFWAAAIERGQAAAAES